MNLPTLSQIRFPKLIVHSILLVSILTLLSLVSQDIVKWILNKNVPGTSSYVNLIAIIWIFFAIQNKKYQK